MKTPETRSEARKTKAEVARQGEQLVIEAYPDILDALIAKAKEGSYQHAKLLFDLVDAAPSKPKDDADDLPGPSLAEILIERLQLMEEEEPGSGLGPESGAMA